jgi:superfamily II DNA or RNA helicase
MNLAEYYEKFGSKITQPSERLFVDEFLYPLLCSKIENIVPQYTFIDSTGKSRRIDFAYNGFDNKIALEVNGETYHAEGIIPNENFDDNLFRQNEILNKGYRLLRFSYNQLQDPKWREIIFNSLRNLFSNSAPELLSEYELQPNPIQIEALDELQYARTQRGWSKGVVVMPTGTGKTILSALESKRYGGKVLFVVHRLDILHQSIEAFKKCWGNLNFGLLTGIEKSNIEECDVLFASRDSLREPETLAKFKTDYFNYIIIDEVHHGQSPSYQAILNYFSPKFMLGMTATPDRTDRKDIFELFDYNKVYEISLSEVIDKGYLVPYTYIGLTDNVDYTNIRYEGQKYKVDDLERNLIIPERNEAIYQAYIASDKGDSDKAIGFCISIKHAERMAKFFKNKGIKAEAIHSDSDKRDAIIEQFRNDDIQIVFTVDIFNEGIDFPNIRVLLFLRPTESKTIFIQQLGRGLRLCAGKDRVRVIDFIGNYKRANQIRKYLAKSNNTQEIRDDNGNRIKKVVYEYSNGCEVIFDKTVEEILDRQDKAEIGIDKEDLIEAYFALAEKLERKPTKADLDEHGEYKSRLYQLKWQTWRKFLQDIGEYTEASYHYPQGTHLGHILSILWFAGLPSREGTHLDPKYIRMRGDLSQGREGTYQRQLKYKLQATMELGLIEDDRTIPSSQNYELRLTARGIKLREALKNQLERIELKFPLDNNGLPSSRMIESEESYNRIMLNAINSNQQLRNLIFELFLGMQSVKQMLKYIFHIQRKLVISKTDIYQGFFSAPFVKRFCEQEGIEEATIEASKRRCPFLLNILAACGVIELNRSDIRVCKLLLIPDIVKAGNNELDAKAKQRIQEIIRSWPNEENNLQAEELSICKELFGKQFLTNSYFIQEVDIYI